jgi:acyl carrier protein
MKTREELLELIKTMALAIHQRETRASREELDKLRHWMDTELTADSPIASLGWDSVRMTWLLVRLEEELEIDTSKMSLYELFTVGDLLDKLLASPRAGAGRG